MGSEAARSAAGLSPLEQLRFGREILLGECQSIRQVADRLDDRFCRSVELLYACRGCVILCGMGKAGLVGKKISATLASTGTRSHFLHPAEAVHGDLGRVHPDDVVLILSQSGQTEEVVRLLPSIERMKVPLLAITSRGESALGRAATIVLELGRLQEAGGLGLAPTSSTTAMLALGDALALVVSRMKHFGREDFARFHPAGSLGRKLSKVEDYCRPLAECRVAKQRRTVREVFVRLSVPGRRTGAIMLVDGRGRLRGIFTDSDLARLFEHRGEAQLDRPISEVMTSNPVTVSLGAHMVEAVETMANRKISELPVIDDAGRPAGLIDVTDVVGLFPELFEADLDQASEPTVRLFPARAGA